MPIKKTKSVESQPVEKQSIQKIMKPKRSKRSKKSDPVIQPACWEVCKLKLDPDFKCDYVHICLGNTHVTRSDLENMMKTKSTGDQK